MSTRIDEPNSMMAEHPQRHQLALTGADAIRALGQFYQTALIDADNVAFEWQNELRNERGRSQHFLEMLGEIARMPGIEKRDEEALPSAVARFIERSTSERRTFSKEAGEAQVQLRVAFLDLCQKHNITKPCDSFTANVTPGDICANCDHPAIVHPPLINTDAVSSFAPPSITEEVAL